MNVGVKHRWENQVQNLNRVPFLVCYRLDHVLGPRTGKLLLEVRKESSRVEGNLEFSIDWALALGVQTPQQRVVLKNVFADSAFYLEEVKAARRYMDRLLVTFYSTYLCEGYPRLFDSLSVELTIFVENRRRCIVQLAGQHTEYCTQQSLE